MATTFAELVSDVYTITNRPDLVNETALAVRAATIKMHSSDFYHKDLFETGVQFDTTAFLQQLEIKELVPRYRAMHFLRKVSTDSSNALILGKEFKEVSPQSLFDAYGQNREDVFYSAGAVINVRSSTAIDKVYLSCYVHPITIADSYSSWIADEYKDLIVIEAAMSIFKGIGYDEQVTFYNAMAKEMFRVMNISNIVATGS